MEKVSLEENETDLIQEWKHRDRYKRACKASVLCFAVFVLGGVVGGSIVAAVANPPRPTRWLEGTT